MNFVNAATLLKKKPNIYYLGFKKRDTRGAAANKGYSDIGGHEFNSTPRSATWAKVSGRVRAERFHFTAEDAAKELKTGGPCVKSKEKNSMFWVSTLSSIHPSIHCLPINSR